MGCFWEPRVRGWFRFGVITLSLWRFLREWGCIYSLVTQFRGSTRFLKLAFSLSIPSTKKVLQPTPLAGWELAGEWDLLSARKKHMRPVFGNWACLLHSYAFYLLWPGNCSCGICGNRYTKKNAWHLLSPLPTLFLSYLCLLCVVVT